VLPDFKSNESAAIRVDEELMKFEHSHSIASMTRNRYVIGGLDVSLARDL
jgi:hypothetical protein